MYIDDPGRPVSDIEIVSVNVGQPSAIGFRPDKGLVYSSIRKKPAGMPNVYLSSTNLSGDQQVETHVKSNGKQLHGGPEMAVYAYPHEHYLSWERELGQDLGPGAFGENLTIVGATEEDVHIGDVWRWASALLVVTKPREPCYKLCMYREVPDMIARMDANGFCGWYLSVRTPGLVPTWGPIEIFSRDMSAPTVAEVYRAKGSKNQNS